MNKARRKRLAEAAELLEQARDILEEVKDEEQEAHDNLPESFQQGERGELRVFRRHTKFSKGVKIDLSNETHGGK